MIETKIVKLRTTGKGLKGTYENIDHHAQALRPFVEALEPHALRWGFMTWRQGSNVHQFDTHYGKSYTLRPIFKRTKGDTGYRYVGIAVSLRISRSQEHVLAHVTRQSDINRLSEMMRLLAGAQEHIVGGSLDRENE